jgi:hypothetical protein
MQSSFQGMTLETIFEERDGRLHGRYRAVNTADTPIFLFNHLHGEFNAGHFPLDAQGVYVEPDQQAVVISQKIVPPPPGTFVERRNVPFVTRVQVGQDFSHAFELALPLRRHTPYGTPVADPGETARRLPAFFELGYFIGQSGTEALARNFPTDKGNRPGFDPFPIKSQLIARTGPFPPLPVVGP